jgi:hypothetical protein
MLPTRRPCETTTIQDASGAKTHITVGFDPDTLDPCEVWGWGWKIGSDAQFAAHETAVMFSHMLQDGDTPQDIVAKTMRGTDGEPLTVGGMMADVLMDYADV